MAPASPPIGPRGQAGEPPASRRALGIALMVCSAFALGLSPSLARFAYRDGIDVLTLATVRGLIAGAAILATLALLGRPVRPTAGTLAPYLGLGVAMTLTSYGYLGAIRYIPVGLAVLTFFTFPLLVGLISRFTEGAPLPWSRLVAIVTGFMGLVLVLGVSFETLDPRGIALALLAAVSVAVQITGGARLMRRQSPMLVTGQMMLWAGVILAAGLAIAGGPQPPVSAVGWLATFGVAAAFMVGILCFFGGVSMIGPVPAAIIANLEPLVAISFAFLLLGEILEPLQLVGAALVIGAIVAGQLAGRA
ncbi:MAG: DMT family transporter [Kiloniellales bacterium]